MYRLVLILKSYYHVFISFDCLSSFEHGFIAGIAQTFGLWFTGDD
jgi:hypothetical protein